MLDTKRLSAGGPLFFDFGPVVINHRLGQADRRRVGIGDRNWLQGGVRSAQDDPAQPVGEDLPGAEDDSRTGSQCHQNSNTDIRRLYFE